MNYKKLFFPIGGGDELEERLYGAFLIAKYFNTNLEILKSRFNANKNLYKLLVLPKDVIDNINNVIDSNYEDENLKFQAIIDKISKELDIKVVKEALENEACITVTIKHGIRSTLVENESKYCDLVVAAAPPSGITTATFETAILKSGKSVLMFPRVMRKFSLDTVIIGWNNSPESSRAITSSIEILKNAQKVHIVTSIEYLEEESSIEKLIKYLKIHKINATYEIVKTTKIPGEALLNAALDGNFDLIVAGAYGHKGLKELMFGGATRYLLEHSTIPVFMSH
ncbi:universal stress protein [Malaciobacter molluscorum LMG 25693]|uniref:Universal stress protein n=1 Tax=Malaciobacter molluscorum LMG 25693 TaxID=870501 RepID=A0A2G1DLX6_9BACT|nr:universal stress protein [Malaciobacter molluscorum]AXX92155.1 putative universal stress protein UspA [Malaciobacter molluscorum LMG 25693]PHO19384.1 universal stress protein [Malaciobacter molluscorum LMG 25693]